MKKAIQFLIFSVLIIFSLIFFSNKLVEIKSENRTYTDVNLIPNAYVGILLGTSKILNSGYENLYYRYRIDAIIKLYKAGKIQRILISGDNSRKEYDEPNDMRNDLVAEGIDSNHIVLDYAGFRTFDSIKRLKEIFGQTKATVISQKFHNERAIYIASKMDIELNGFNAKDVNTYYGFKTQLREYLARVKTVLDFIIGVEPKFLGEKVVIK